MVPPLGATMQCENDDLFKNQSHTMLWRRLDDRAAADEAINIVK